MPAVINGLKDKFFDVDPGDEDYPKAWVRNQNAKDYRNELRAKANLKKQGQDKLAILDKRKASRPFPAGEAIVEKKRKDMEKVVGIQAEVDKKEEELDRLYEKREKALDAPENLEVKD